MSRPVFALLASLAPFAALTTLACGDASGPDGPAPSYEVTITPRATTGAPTRFTGKAAQHVTARVPIDARQTVWRTQLSIRMMSAKGPPVAVLLILFPDTTIRFGRIDLARPRPGPFPPEIVATGQVTRLDGTGLYDVASGQVELTQGPGGVVEGSFTAQLVPIAPPDAIVETVADAAGQFVARRLTW